MANELSDYHTALDAFVASPTEATKNDVLAARAKLPDNIQDQGGSATLPNLQTLKDTLDGMLRGALRSATNGRRLIRTGLRHER